MKAADWKRFEVQVSRTAKAPAKEFRIESPASAVRLFTEDVERLTQESLWVLTLDGRNGLMGIERVYQGTATGTSVRIGELFRYAVAVGGVGIVLVHNHPSGDHTPSDEDVRLTSEVIAAAKLLDVQMVDHLVIGAGGAYSSIRSQQGSLWEEREAVMA